MRCGVIMTPWLPMAAATSAFCRAVSRTFCCPIAEYASAGRLNCSVLADGKLLAATFGRSSGGELLKPYLFAVDERMAPPRSMPTRAKPVSHDGGSISAMVPPQLPNPKLERVRLDWGRLIVVLTGYTLFNRSGLPSRTAEVVTTFMVEPGGNEYCVAIRARGSKKCALGFVIFFHWASATVKVVDSMGAGS